MRLLNWLANTGTIAVQRAAAEELARAVGVSTAPRGGTILDRYRDALKYLDGCGQLDEGKMRQFNEIAGRIFSESDLQNYARQAEIAPSGWGMVKQTLRSAAQESIAAFEKLQAQGVDLSALKKRAALAQGLPTARPDDIV